MELPKLKSGFICCFGAAVLDRIVALSEPFPFGGQIPGTIEARPGGSAPNVAVAAARSGARSRFVGHCGQGELRPQLLAMMTSAGVEVEAVSTGNYTETLGLVFLDGKATYITDSTGEDMLSAEHVDGAWLADAAVLHCTGYNFFDDAKRPALERIVSLAHDAGVPVTFDVALSNESFDFGLDRFRRYLVEVMKPVVVFCNQWEGDALGLDQGVPDGLQAVVQHRSLAATRVHAAGGGVYDVPIEDPLPFRDVVGAGDEFAGAFLAAWQSGEDIVSSVEHGHSASRSLLERRNA